MYSCADTRCRVGCPIRISTDQSLLAAPHGFSQRATSFIASWCQGIHRTPFSCSQPREHKAEALRSHLAQEPSNPSFNVQDLSPSGLPSNSFDGSLQCRPNWSVARTTAQPETDAPSSTSILFTLLNTSGCGDLDRSHDPPPVRLATGASRRAKP